MSFFLLHMFKIRSKLILHGRAEWSSFRFCYVHLFWLDKVARLFGPAIFEVSKLEVLFLGMDQKKHPADLPRTYTLTHSDITSKITLSISQTINNSQVFLQCFFVFGWDPWKSTCLQCILVAVFAGWYLIWFFRWK